MFPSAISGILILVNSSETTRARTSKITVLDLGLFSVPGRKNTQRLEAHENMSIRCNCSPRGTLFLQVKNELIPNTELCSDD